MDQYEFELQRVEILANQYFKLLTGGRVTTLDPQRPSAEAVLVAGDRIAELGSADELKRMAPEATEIDVSGMVVYPGFIEPHSHVIGYGLAESRAAVFYNRNLAPITSKHEMLDLVSDEVRNRSAGEWITGRGYAISRWPGEELLTRHELDRVAPDNPVALNDLGGHTTMTNSVALQRANITRNTPQPPNGTIFLDESGEPNGILDDAAQAPVFGQIPNPSDDELLEAARVATRNMSRMGITMSAMIRNLFPGGYFANQHRPFFELERRGELPIRIWLMVEGYRDIGKPGEFIYTDAMSSLGIPTGFGNMVRFGPVKVISDGWMDSRSGAEYEDYADRPGHRGYLYRPAEDYTELVLRAHRAGYQLAIHCDGLRSTDVILDAYEHAMERLPREDHRHRLEHVPVLTDIQIERIKRLGLSVCSVPSYRMNSWYKDMMARAYGPERLRLTLRYRSLIDAGVHVFGGSDCHPCEEKWLHPIGQITLNSVDGPPNEAERLTRAEAVSMFTTSAAYASFDEDEKGTFSVGKLADFTVLSDDPLTVSDDELRSIKVHKTIVGGDVVFDDRAD
jgi:predicted amidohydrolase YtcJ